MNQTIIIKETNHSAGDPISFSGNELLLFADKLTKGNHTTSLYVDERGIRQRGSDKFVVWFSDPVAHVNANQFDRLCILAEKYNAEYNAACMAYFADDSFEEE